MSTRDGAPRYLLHGRLGEGGMGVVHLGTLTSPAGERLVAIKQLIPRREIDPEARNRLIAEARLAFRLTHANICQVIDLGEGEQGTFMVMEYVRGLDLNALERRLRKTGHPLDVPSAVYVAREVARALDYAHRCANDAGRLLGLVHGDVTPQNVLISVEGEVKLSDFGIARSLGGTSPGAKVIGGTPGFLAPEVASGNIDHRADIYSLGVTLYVSLVGPRSGGELDPSDLSRHRPEVTPDLCAIVERATAIAPADRFLSAGDLERALSLELARRHPGFTPSLLAQVVRKNTSRSAPRSAPQSTLTSLTSSEDASRAGPPSHAVTKRAKASGRPKTVTVLRTKVAFPALSIALVVAIGVALWAGRPHRATPLIAVPPIASPSPPSVPSPAVPPPALLPPAAAPARRRASSLTRGAGSSASSRSAPAFITVNATPWASVYVDGRRLAAETPAYRLAVAPGTHSVAVRFEDRGQAASAKQVRVDSGQSVTVGFRKARP